MASSQCTWGLTSSALRSQHISSLGRDFTLLSAPLESMRGRSDKQTEDWSSEHDWFTIVCTLALCREWFNVGGNGGWGDSVYFLSPFVWEHSFVFGHMTHLSLNSLRASTKLNPASCPGDKAPLQAPSAYVSDLVLYLLSPGLLFYGNIRRFFFVCFSNMPNLFSSKAIKTNSPEWSFLQCSPICFLIALQTSV